MNYSVLICTYNGERFIRQQLSSILDQAIVPETIILSDDGSHDSTIKIAEEVFQDYEFTDFIVIYGPKSGPAQNFLNGLEYNSSEFLLLSDQDDIWESTKVDLISSRLSGYDNEQPILFFSDSSLIDENGAKFDSSFIQYQGLDVEVLTDDSLLFRNCVQGATVCINKALITIALKSKDFGNILMHDWWLALVAKYYGDIIYVDEPLVQYRQHASNEVGAQSKKVKLKRIITQPKFYFSSAKDIVRQCYAFSRFSVDIGENDKNRNLTLCFQAKTRWERLKRARNLRLNRCGLFKKFVLMFLIFVINNN